MTKHEVSWAEIMEYGDCSECGGEGFRATQHTHGAGCDESVCTEYTYAVDCDGCRGTGRAYWTPEMTAEAMLLCEWYSETPPWHEDAWKTEDIQLSASKMVFQVARAFAAGQCQAGVAREAFQALLGVES